MLLLLPVVLALLASGFTDRSGPAQAADNPIVVENRQAGTDAWQIPTGNNQLADDTSNQVKGYPSAPSVNKGGSLTFYVTVNPAQTYTIDVYRMGWYGGLGGRLLQHVGAQTGVQQPACPVVDPSTSLLACNWSPSYTLTVPPTWTDGIFLAVLTNAQGFQSYVPFVVRDDARAAGLLYQQPVNTYQAYNAWGGKSLYNYNSTGGVRANKVSFDRPYGDDGSADYFGWEVYFVQWLEQQGYDVTYATDVDAQVNGGRLRAFKGVLVGGHSEYWSKAMYDAFQGARDAGVSLGFFGSNDIYWQVRYEASAGGVANRVLVCYKPPEPPNPTDPVSATTPTLTTTQWRLNPVNRPEQALVGVQFTSQTGNTWDNTVPYVVTSSGDPIYAGTGFSDGASVPGIVGYEGDRLWGEYLPPSSQSYAQLARSPYTNVNGASDFQNTSLYHALSGAWVFGAGTESWAWALGRPGFVDARIQQTSANVLNRFLTNVPQQATPTPTPVPAPSAYRSAVLADQPISYWRLGEAGGVTAVDQQHAYNGLYVNGPALGRQGALFSDPDTAVALNGTNQSVSVPADAGLNPRTFSFEVWAYPTGGAGTYRGAMASRFYPQGWTLYAAAGNAWEFWVNNGTGIISVAGGTVALNTWQYVAGTFDGTTARLYINGVQVASGNVTAPYQPQTRSALAIGQSEPGANLFFPGALDEAAVYNGALSASRVQAHYSIGTTGH